MKFKAIIIDDEQHCIDTLSWQLNKYCPEIELVDSFSSSTQGLEYLNTTTVDVVFLDIEMPELNGFDLLKAVGSINFQVIFTTAYDEFALKAFRASAVDYLLKPIDKTDLQAAISKLAKPTATGAYMQQLENLFKNLQHQQPGGKIALPTLEGLHFVKAADIIYCTSDSNYTNIFLTDGGKLLVSKTLKEIEAILQEQGFLRIHHSHMINLSKIDRYLKGDGGYVVMEDGKSLSVSRARKEAFLQSFQ